MRWPWSREKRHVSPADTVSSTAYSDARIAAILAAAGGDAAADVNAIAAAEIASGLWGRAFASASVEPMTAATRGITPQVRELIGRELVRKGEALFLIQVLQGQAALMPVSWWDTYGSYQPESWEYQITLAGPDQTTTMRVEADRVVHARYACTPTEPWRGVSPLAHSRATSDLAAMLETRLSQEVTAAVGTLIPIPANASDTTELQEQLARLRGKIALVPTTAAGWDTGGRAGAPRSDWRAERLGANPPSVLDMLRSSSAKHVLAACGLPVELVECPVRAPGPARRSGASCTPPSPRPLGLSRWSSPPSSIPRSHSHSMRSMPPTSPAGQGVSIHGRGWHGCCQGRGALGAHGGRDDISQTGSP